MTTPAGRINKLFGTEGGLMLSLYGAFPDDFTTGTPLMVTIDGLEVPLWCERFERRGRAGAVAAFADFDTERQVMELIGREFNIESAAQANDAQEEFYMEDLIGFAVEGIEGDDANSAFRGVVTDFFDSDANPLFEIEIRGRGVLVPAAEEFITHIDFEHRTMRLQLPEGLIALAQ